ncbi:MAG: FG-GAP-like repeat-containing protein [Terracidiphilus sp.]|nr:FG-GAP-like repeat-containing protein [Terracidiphilus sp.]
MQHPGIGSGFTVAPFIPLSAAPTSVAAGDLNGDGGPDLVVTTNGSNVTVFLADGNGGFKPGLQYPAGIQTGNALLADLNADGKLDLVVTDSAAGTVNVLFGNGDGTFGKPFSYAAIQNPVGLSLGNFAGKGKIDLAVASQAGLAVLLNDGSGHFPTATPAAISSQPLSLAAADLSGSGYDDLVLANQDGTISVLLGDGNGGFHAAIVHSIALGPLTSVVAGDFNGDGKADIAVSQANSNTLSVLLSDGDGSFQPAAQYTVGNSPTFVIAADLKGKGTTDLITINRAANTFSVLQGNGDGTFGSAQDFVAGASPLAAVAGDFNADGHLDLAIVNSGDNTISVPLGRGNGTFAAARSYRAGLANKAIAAGDLNGDGRQDLVVVNSCGSDTACSSAGTATIFLANPDGTYQAASTVPLGNGPVSVALADLNGDKKLDLLALNRIDKTLMVLPGSGNGTFGAGKVYNLAENPSAFYVGDFNKDGIPDVAIATDCGQQTCAEAGNVDIWLGRSDGSLAEASSYAVGYSPVSIAAADLRGTGNLDLVVANACGSDSSCKSDGTATLLAGDGTGKFSPLSPIDIGKTPSAIALGNLSGSGFDLAVAQRGSNQVAIMSANGSGGFDAPVNYPVGSAPSSLAIADFNGDGYQDLAVANFQSSTVSVLHGTATGTLQPAVTYPVGAGPESLVAVTRGAGSKAGLVTANGRTGATPMGNQFTALGSADLGTGATTVTFTSAANTTTVDQTATIAGNVAGAGPTPTGKLVFAVDASGTGAGPFTDLADCGGSTGIALDGSGDASCTTQMLPAGSPTYVQLQYSGDPNYAAKTSANDQGQTVSPANTSTTVGLTSGSNPSTVDDTLTFTATVNAPSGAAVQLNGTVTFTDNGNAISVATCGTAGAVGITWNPASSQGTAGCTTNALTGGNHVIVATYGNDSNYNGSSGFVTQKVNTAGGTMTIGSSSAGNASTVNQSVTFTASINPSTGNTDVPLSGSVTFTDTPQGGSATTICANVPVSPATGKAACPTSSLALGTHTITATYSNDPSYTFSPAPLTQTVNKANTSVVVTNPTNPSSVNQAVTFTATVTPNPSGSVALSGNVTFSDVFTPSGGTAQPSTVICAATNVSVAVNGTGTVMCADSTLGLGSHAITATYGNDPNFNDSTNSPVFTQTVGAATSSITLSSSSPANTSVVNQAVTFTASIPAPSGSLKLTGQVSFADNGVAISGCTGVGVTATSSTNYTATCPDSSLTASASPHTITASYGGDSNFTVGAGTPLTQVVNKAPTGVTVTSGSNPSQVNVAVTFTATVAPNPSGTIAPSGTVAFTDSVGGAISGCSAVGFNAGTTTATCTTSALAVDKVNNGNDVPHIITANYSGDANFTSNSNTTSQSVEATTETITFPSTTPTSSTVNQSVSFTAGFAKPSSGTIPSGQESYTDNGSLIPGCANLSPSLSNGTYVTTCTYSAFSFGTHTIVASYSGDLNLTVLSGSTTLKVAAGTPSITLGTPQPPIFTSSGNTKNYDDSVTFTATVSAPTGAAVPLSIGTGGTGIVTFSGNGIPASCSAAPVNAAGQASCTTTTLPTTAYNAADTITATYSGDLNYLIVSATVTQVVEDYQISIANVSTLGTLGVPVTQGYATGQNSLNTPVDPFLPASLPAVTSPSSANYAVTPTITCSLLVLVANAPTCTLVSPSLQIASGSGIVQQTVGITINAAGANPGTYTFAVTATDPTTSIVRTATFPVTVRPAMKGSNALTLVSGSATGNSTTVTFYPQSGVTSLKNLTCQSISGTGITTLEAPSKVGVACSFSPATLTSSPFTTTVTITTNNTFADAKPMNIGNRGSALLVAALFGAPVFVLLGFRRSRKTFLSNLARMSAIAVIAMGAMYSLGCGGSFTGSTTAVTGGTTPPGTYYLLIQSTGNDNNSYQTVLQVNVNL